MLVRVGDLVQRPAATGSSSPAGGNDRTLYPIAEYLPPSHVDEPPFDQAGAQDEVDRNAGGILLDADREVQFRFAPRFPNALCSYQMTNAFYLLGS